MFIKVTALNSYVMVGDCDKLDDDVINIDNDILSCFFIAQETYGLTQIFAVKLFTQLFFKQTIFYFFHT